MRAAEFASEFAVAVRNGSQDGFRDGYLDIDMLLVDDIQDMDGKDDIQAEFLRSLPPCTTAAGSSSSPPTALPSNLVSIEDRLRTRLGQGLVADIVVIEDDRER